MSYVPMNADPVTMTVVRTQEGCVTELRFSSPLWGCGWCGQVVELDDPRAGQCCDKQREWGRKLNETLGLAPTPPPPRDPVRWDRVVRRWEAKHAPAVVMSRWDNREIF